MSPKDLAQVLRRLPKFKDANLLVGSDTLDDAGVYRISRDIALVQTVDIFTPLVDDPYDYGCIVGANSLSDVYAMGGRPLTVLNIIGFPPKKMDHHTISEILRGGAAKVKEAGALMVGGHSINDPEVKYGMAVTGVVRPDRVITNAGARPGDVLILTKPLGVGIITMANIIEKLPDEVMKPVIKSMVTLNKTAAEVMIKTGVNACTDVTGFGLIGHTYIIARMSKVSIRIQTGKLPVFEAAREYARRNIMPGGSFTNKEYYGQFVKVESGISQEMQDICFDAQTSGGLLMSVKNSKADKMIKELHKQGVREAVIIGEVIRKSHKPIILSN
jgi:selenide,water dikinase